MTSRRPGQPTPSGCPGTPSNLLVSESLPTSDKDPVAGAGAHSRSPRRRHRWLHHWTKLSDLASKLSPVDRFHAADAGRGCRPTPSANVVGSKTTVSHCAAGGLVA